MFYAIGLVAYSILHDTAIACHWFIVNGCLVS